MCLSGLTTYTRFLIILRVWQRRCCFTVGGAEDLETDFWLL